MKAKRYLIYYVVGLPWFVVAAITVAVLPQGNSVGWLLLAGGLIAFTVASMIEQTVFHSYLKTWDSQLLGDYATSPPGCAGPDLRWLSFTREDNGDPEFQEHKRATRAVSTVWMLGFVAIAILTVTGQA